MSVLDAHSPAEVANPCDPVAVVITPKEKDLGGFSVRRALPSIERRSLGPFVFVDQMGPARFPVGQGIDVRPHPHIGIATLTWLVEGRIYHEDSLGTKQVIEPGEVNWMIAGRGIVHSERAPAEDKVDGAVLFGMQVWLALPIADEETDPKFEHYAAADIPRIEGEGYTLSLVAGTGFGLKSPVTVFSETIYCDIAMKPDGTVMIPPEHAERGLYVTHGEIEVGGKRFSPGNLVVLKEGRDVEVTSHAQSRYFLIGGAPLDGPRRMFWNFVSSHLERVEQAKDDWREGRFPMIEGDDTFIPLPE